MDNYRLRSFEAMDGDCFILDYESGEKMHHIWIDGGEGIACRGMLEDEVDRLKEQNEGLPEEQKEYIDLIILTHIDIDHIENLLALLDEGILDSSIVKEFWFNYGEGLKEELERYERQKKEERKKKSGKQKAVMDKKEVKDLPVKDILVDQEQVEIATHHGRSVDRLIQERNIVRRSCVKEGDCFDHIEGAVNSYPFS